MLFYYGIKPNFMSNIAAKIGIMNFLNLVPRQKAAGAIIRGKPVY